MPVMKMCVAVSTGEEWPVGTVAFHTTFFSGPNSAGRAERLRDAGAVRAAEAGPVGLHRRSGSRSLRRQRENGGENEQFHGLFPMAQRNFVVRKYIVPPEMAGELSE